MREIHQNGRKVRFSSRSFFPEKPKHSISHTAKDFLRKNLLICQTKFARNVCKTELNDDSFFCVTWLSSLPILPVVQF